MRSIFPQSGDAPPSLTVMLLLIQRSPSTLQKVSTISNMLPEEQHRDTEHWLNPPQPIMPGSQDQGLSDLINNTLFLLPVSFCTETHLAEPTMQHTRVCYHFKFRMFL